ncbi:MAG: hypothetical protein AAFP68_16005, partial [Pseudomonadota bacterium]
MASLVVSPRSVMGRFTLVPAVWITPAHNIRRCWAQEMPPARERVHSAEKWRWRRKMSHRAATGAKRPAIQSFGAANAMKPMFFFGSLRDHELLEV